MYTVMSVVKGASPVDCAARNRYRPSGAPERSATTVTVPHVIVTSEPNTPIPPSRRLMMPRR